MTSHDIPAVSPLSQNFSYELPAFAGFEEDQLLSAPYTKQRKIAKTPFKVLDAPALQDDFYLNLVDWSSQN
jgi:cell division cycle 20-like protein 1 (cofactor of APC complex)